MAAADAVGEPHSWRLVLAAVELQEGNLASARTIAEEELANTREIGGAVW
jgi:hypothetical protein